ncbi:unnamed protein product [Alopecurus aequalis]
MEASSSHQESSVPLPCLVIDHGGAGGEPRTTLLDISHGHHQYRPCENIDVLRRDRRRWVTPHGWVLSWDPSTFSTFLWSPQTSEKIALPSLTQEMPMDSECSLSDKPTSNSGFTVVVVEPAAADTVIWYCHVGGTAGSAGWVRHEYDLGSDMVPGVGGMMHIRRPITRLTATTGGRFYFIKDMDELGVVEFSPDPVITSIKVPAVKRPPAMTSMAPVCVELDGELYLVTAFLHSHLGVETSVLGGGVYRLDFAGRRWRRVRSVGDRAFLMCPSYFGGWCAATASGLRPNCVYWMSPCHNLNNLLHVFDIDGGNTVQVHDPFKGGVPGMNCNAVWMLPTHP